MDIIRHRINKVSDLRTVNPAHGVEIDLRSSLKEKGKIHLSHDPWIEGDSFGEWLAEFHRLKIKGCLILNTKEDGLEERILNELSQYEIPRYLFLDTTIPTLVKYVEKGMGRSFFVRLSSYEPAEWLSAFRGSVEWIWVDCFQKTPLQAAVLDSLKSDFKFCLVSPELHGGISSEISAFRELAKRAHAVCTKFPEDWS